LWSGNSIGEISSMARKILKGQLPENMTKFESFLAGQRND
jgi:hypothetical protein